MQPHRQVLEDAPESFPIPRELRHRRIEIILWPLDDNRSEPVTRGKPKFSIADVEKIDIPSREERNARR